MVLSNKEWLDKMDEIISAIQNGDSQVIEDMLSNMWISSVTYNVGDYVLYNNNIWKCLVQNSNVAPSEGSTWTSVKITDEISTLNSNLSNKSNIPESTFINISGNSFTTFSIIEDYGQHFLFTVTCINTQYYYVGLVLNGWQQKGIIPIVKSGNIQVEYNSNNITISNTSSTTMDFYYSLITI